MNEDRPQPESLEAALGEWSALQSARVFEPTPVDTRALLAAMIDDGARRDPHRPMRIRWGAVAAAAMLAFGMWGAMFSWQLSDVRRTASYTLGPDEFEPCRGNFLDCFAHSAVADSGASCRGFDFDGDGDIDLADFGAYQSNCDQPVTR